MKVKIEYTDRILGEKSNKQRYLIWINALYFQTLWKILNISDFNIDHLTVIMVFSSFERP